jgi:putative membrane protein
VSTPDLGPDPTDPRYSLANERTFLAYERTAVGLLVAAVGALHLLQDSWAEYALGVGLLVAAALTSVVGWLRFQQADAAIRDGRPLPRGIGVPVVVAAVLVLSVLAGLSVLV